jgi:hypothetical protein
MVRRILKSLAGVVAVTSALWGVGVAFARRFERDQGLAVSEDFRVAAFWGGREFSSSAAPLRTGTAIAILGGADIDLTGATVDGQGARLNVRAYFGGVQVTVPPTWRVEVHQDVQGGEVELRIPDPEALPADAPILRASVTVRAGGVLITSATD